MAEGGQGTRTGPGNFALGKSPKEIESHRNPKTELSRRTRFLKGLGSLECTHSTNTCSQMHVHTHTNGLTALTCRSHSLTLNFHLRFREGKGEFTFCVQVWWWPVLKWSKEWGRKK